MVHSPSVRDDIAALHCIPSMTITPSTGAFVIYTSCGVAHSKTDKREEERGGVGNGDMQPPDGCV